MYGGFDLFAYSLLDPCYRLLACMFFQMNLFTLDAKTKRKRLKRKRYEITTPGFCSLGIFLLSKIGERLRRFSTYILLG